MVQCVGMAKCKCGATILALEWPKNKTTCDKCSLQRSMGQAPASATQEAKRRARTEVCPTCGKALKADLTLLHCVDQKCGWNTIVKTAKTAPPPAPPAPAKPASPALPLPPLAKARERRAQQEQEARVAIEAPPPKLMAEIDDKALAKAIIERLRTKPRSLTDLAKTMRVDKDRLLGLLKQMRMVGTLGHTELRGWYLVGVDGPACIEDDMVSLPFVKGLIARLSDADLAALGAWMEPHARSLKAKHEMDVAAARVVDALRKSAGNGPLPVT